MSARRLLTSKNRPPPPRPLCLVRAPRAPPPAPHPTWLIFCLRTVPRQYLPRTPKIAARLHATAAAAGAKEGRLNCRRGPPGSTRIVSAGGPPRCGVLGNHSTELVNATQAKCGSGERNGRRQGSTFKVLKVRCADPPAPSPSFSPFATSKGSPVCSSPSVHQPKEIRSPPRPPYRLLCHNPRRR